MFWGALGDSPCFLASRNRAGLFLNKRLTCVAECFDRTMATVFLDWCDEGCIANGAAHRSIPILGREQRRRDMVVSRQIGGLGDPHGRKWRDVSKIAYIMMSSDDDHYLGSYLSEILPTIGLDIETYAPYVTAYVSHTSLCICLYFLYPKKGKT